MPNRIETIATFLFRWSACILSGMKRWILLLGLCLSLNSCSNRPGIMPSMPPEKRTLTPLERSGFETLPDSAGITEFILELAALSAQAKVLTLGESAGGRRITGVLVSKDPVFLSGTERKEDRILVMLVGSQHGTEPSGAEALQIVLRDLLQGELRPYLDRMDFFIVADSNPDGRDCRKRVNSNGINLSTDFVLLSQPESRAISDALHRYQPQVLLDIHESAILKKKTLGAQGYLTDFQTQFEFANNPNIHPALRDWAEVVFLPDLIGTVRSRGMACDRYIGEITDVNQPITHGGLSLRNLRNYAGLQGILSILVENKLDPPGEYPSPRNIEVRVRNQVRCLVAFIEQISNHREEIRARTRLARDAWKERPGSMLALGCHYAADRANPAIQISLTKLENGETVVRTFEYRGRVIVDRWIDLPQEYFLTEGQEAMVQFLERHHIRYDTCPKVTTVSGETRKIRLEPGLEGQGEPAAGHGRHQGICEETETEMTVEPGYVRIDPRQPAGRLFAVLCDPCSADLPAGLAQGRALSIVAIDKPAPCVR